LRTVKEHNEINKAIGRHLRQAALVAREGKQFATAKWITEWADLIETNPNAWFFRELEKLDGKTTGNITEEKSSRAPSKRRVLESKGES
jgi:hypothetical protein